MGMPGIGELAIIGIIIGLIFGPKQIPKLGKAFGETIREFRGVSKELSSARDTLEDEVLDAKRTVRDALDPPAADLLGPDARNPTAAEVLGSIPPDHRAWHPGQDRKEKTTSAI